MGKLEQKIKKLGVKYIDFGWASFELQFVTVIKSEGNYDEIFGETSIDQRYIKILSNQNDDILRDTLLHEIIHVIHATVGLDSDIVELEEEQRCRLMTQGLLLLFKLNPKLKHILF